ncbi:MAG: ATP-dependent RNA helicase HrpA [Opitutaceae bacterium]
MPPRPDFPFRIEFPPDLPISARAEEITAAIQAHPAVVLAGETGSGKTTQIPKMCLAAGRGSAGRIACTQPRRVAALSISRRVAEELGAGWGREVGCKVRFSDRTTAATRVKFLTDGMLLSEAQGDPLLREYDTIIVDEAHERSLNIDFLLGHLRQLLPRRPDLKVIVTSATIDTAAFSEAFGGAPVVIVEGRAYPVETIYAPLDSFGSDADPGSADAAEKAEALHYIDGAVEAVRRIVRDSDAGDVLVFLPSERDVREVRDLLDGGTGRGCELVPLFGRLGNAEQQRVFAPTQRRKIVVATNIAETSLTIPGIRFVVDSGLARVSRYAAQSRTRRLPIEAISRSSADQRKGRCGRVAEGVCVRLYSEEDYLGRPQFGQPEIQRANLADVILRLKAFAFGEVEDFPFLSPPAPKAVRAGYALLEELGAIERAGEPLTAIGGELARLPVDPTVGRMILQARTERALREVLAIAAALSVQDPRERPMDRQAEADAAHRRFAHPDSDFLSLLNIWEAYHESFETMGQARLRRFCREHFLSYTRMREWRDVHAQLLQVLEERRDFRMTSVFDGAASADDRRLGFGTPAYRAIHRSVLAGLLGNIAMWDEANGGYKATNDRRVALFPGSTLFRRPSKTDGAKSRKPSAWIMAAEIVETTKVYARTCARLDPSWALDLAAHLVKVSHSEPFWDSDAGRVRVKRRTRLYGLEIDARAVGYGKIDPGAATDIFIREALVNDTVEVPLEFLVHNRDLRERIASTLTRARHSGYLNLDEALFRFYFARLRPEETGPEGVSSVAELAEIVRERRRTDPLFLFAEEGDLHDPDAVEIDPAAFPAQLPMENRVLSLQYRYRPGEEDDGVTLELGLQEAQGLTAVALDWAVPGNLEAKVEHYLRALPKELRRAFVPLAENAKRLAATVASRHRLTDGRETVAEALAAELRERHRIGLTAAIWAAKPPPEHLRVRVRVRDETGKELVASRDLGEIEGLLAARREEASALSAERDPQAWSVARERGERGPQTGWTFGDLPACVKVTEQGGLALFAYPGLRTEAGGVALRLFHSEAEAADATRAGLAELLRIGLRYDLGWLERDLRAMREVGPLAAAVAPVDKLREDGLTCLEAWLCDPGRYDDALRSVAGSGVARSEAGRAAGTAGAGRASAPAAKIAADPAPGPDPSAGAGAPSLMGAPALKANAFAAALQKAKADSRGLAPRFIDRVKEILTLRQDLLVHPQPYSGLAQDAARLVGPAFLRTTPFGRLKELPRYLTAAKARADRWRKNPAKDADRAGTLAPYAAAAAAGKGGPGFRWLVEELRVSLFAQELGTLEPVSPVKLDQLLAAAHVARGGSAEKGPPSGPAPGVGPKAPAPAPAIPRLPGDAKQRPLKSLSGLDKLFRP